MHSHWRHPPQGCIFPLSGISSQGHRQQRHAHTLAVYLSAEWVRSDPLCLCCSISFRLWDILLQGNFEWTLAVLALCFCDVASPGVFAQISDQLLQIEFGVVVIVLALCDIWLRNGSAAHLSRLGWRGGRVWQQAAAPTHTPTRTHTRTHTVHWLTAWQRDLQ